MIKKLTSQGNSTALILDRQVMQLMGIDKDSHVSLHLNGRQLVIEPLSDEERDTRMQEIQRKVMNKNSELFKRLAQ